MWPGVIVWVKRLRSAQTKSFPLCCCQKKTGRRKQCRVLATLHPHTPPPPPLCLSACGGKSPSGKAQIKATPFFFRATKDVGETKVKGQAKHLEKPKSSLSLTTGCPFIRNARFQIHLPSGASPHLRNSMTHPCLLSRHCENKRQTDSMLKAQPFREQLGLNSTRHYIRNKKCNMKLNSFLDESGHSRTLAPSQIETV